MSIFRDTFDKTIIGSIKKRQNAMINRTPENIQYLNTRNAWIRMTSAVNVNESNTLASQYVLQGGTLNPNNTLKSGIGSNTSNAYSTVSPSGKTHKFGIRPMPGITDLNIKSKTAYGSLREANVNFQCWDISQLEDLELLYMRPGYTVLVEWGWAPYIDSTGKYNPTFTDFYSNDLLNFKPGSKTKDQIFKELYQKSIDYSGNYDAMYGYVKNFEWSAREDGGYDCSTTIISPGEIIESLKVNYVRADLKKYKMYENGSIGDGFLNSLFETQGNNPSVKFVEYYQKNTLAGVWAELALKLKDPNAPAKFSNYEISDIPGLTNYGDLNTFIQPGSGLKVYITLDSVFAILNNYIIAQSGGEPLVKLSTKTETYSGKDEEDLLCVAHPLQVSVDPTVCLINSPLWYEKIAPTISGSQDLVTTMIAASLNQPGATSSTTLSSEDASTGTTSPPLANTPPTAEDKQTAEDAADKLLESSVGAATDLPLMIEGFELITNIQIFNEVQKLLAKNDEDEDYISIQTILNGELDPGNEGRAEEIKAILSKIGVKVEYDVETGTRGRGEETYTELIKGSFKLSIPNTPPTTSKRYESVNGTVVEVTAEADAEDPTAVPPATSETPTSVFSVEGAISSLQFLEKLNTFFYKDEPDRELGIISNIYVSLDFLYRQSLSQGLESGDSKEKNEINLYGYLKSVISGIQKALGNVNNFEIHVDPVDNVARVIDVNYTAPSKPSDLFELQVHKTNSIVRSYKLQSQIFPSQTTIVSTASQTRGGQIGIQNNTMIDYNKNITDRIIQQKQDSSSAIINGDETDQGNSLASTLVGVVLLFGFLGTKPADGSPSTLNIEELVSKAKNSMRDLIVYFQTLQSESPGRNRNIIPTKFSFEMDGIGGLIVGSLFKINKDILPKGYKGEEVGKELAKIITGISHEISNGDWITKIDAQTFILDRPEFGTFGKFDIASLIKTSLNQIVKEKVGFPPLLFLSLQNPLFLAAYAAYNVADALAGDDIGSDFNLFFYLQWQQGASGAAQHYSLWKRNGKYTKYNIPAANIYQNWPGASGIKSGNPQGGFTSAKGITASDVIRLYNNGQHSELAEAFIDVQRQLFVKKAAAAPELLNSSKSNRAGIPYTTIKAAFQKYARPDVGLTADRLGVFGMIENGLETDTPSGAPYQSMLQISTQYYQSSINQMKQTKLSSGNINYDIDDVLKVTTPILVTNWDTFRKNANFTG